MSPVYGELPKPDKYWGEYNLATQLASFPDPKLHLIFNIGWIEDANEADILIWHEEAGVFVVEVKAVNLTAITGFGRRTCEIEGRGKGPSPQVQAYGACEGLRKYLDPYFERERERRPFIVPTACFPKISRYEWDRHWSSRKVDVGGEHAERMIFREDLSSGPTAFRERLRYVYRNPPVRKGAFGPFRHKNKALDTLKDALLAEAKPEPGVTDLERLRQIEKNVKAKTRGEAPADGSTRLAYRGYPGTGKTFRLLGIAHEHALAGRRVLFACYNNVLASDLRRLMSFSEELTSAAGQLEIRGVHELLGIEGAALGIERAESDGVDGWAHSVAEGVISSTDVLRYDTVLVDEAQDMVRPENALRLLEHLCEPEGTLCVAAGTGQELYGDTPEWLDQFLERADTKDLRRNFRNSEPVFRLAHTFYEAGLDENRIPAALGRFGGSGSKDAEVLFERRGSLARLCYANDDELNGYGHDQPDFPSEQRRVMVREYQHIIKEQLDEMHHVHTAERSKEYHFDLLILVPSENQSEYEWAKEALCTLLGGAVAYTDYVRGANRRDSARRDAVRLCTFHSARGIEGTRVIVFGLDKVGKVVGGGNARLRNLGYIALSRSLFELTVVFTKSRSEEPVRRFVERVMEQIEVAEDGGARTTRTTKKEAGEELAPQASLEPSADKAAEALAASGTTRSCVEHAHEPPSSQGGEAGVGEVTLTNGTPTPNSSRLDGPGGVREADIKQLDSRLKAWADQMRAELALYQDGWHLWNRIQYDFLSSLQKRTLAPEIQELFQQQSEIEQEYRSLDAVGRYKKRLRTFSNLSDEFVRKVLVQRGYNTPPRKNQEPATSEEVNGAQATTSSARSTKVTGRRRDDTTAPLAPTDPKWLADKAEHSLAECERLLEWVSKSIQDVSAEREKQLKIIAAAREHSARAWERYHRVVDTTLDETRRHQAREEMDAAECREGRESADISSPRFDVEYRKAVAREVAESLRDTLLPGLDEMAARNDDPRLQQTISECKEGVERATLYVINRFPAQGPLRDDKIWRARIEAQKLVNGTWVG